MNDYTETVEGVVKLKTEYQYNSTEGIIDSGKITSMEIRTDDKQSIESVVIGVE